MKLNQDQIKREELRLLITTSILAFSSAVFFLTGSTGSLINGVVKVTLFASMIFSLLYILATGSFLKYGKSVAQINDITVTPSFRFKLYNMTIDIFGANILLFVVWSLQYGLDKLWPDAKYNEIYSWILGFIVMVIFIIINVYTANNAKAHLDKY